MATQIYAPPSNNDTLGVYEIFKYVNTVSDGIFFVGLAFVIWIIIFVSTKNYSSSRAFTFASFVSFILTLVLTVIDLISPKIMYLFVLLLAGGAMWMKLEAQSLG